MKEINIRNGYIVNGSETSNQWVTSIQCVLETPSRTAFLSHECRAESVHYLGNNGPGIFIDRNTGLYISGSEWITVTMDDNFYCISGYPVGSKMTQRGKDLLLQISENTFIPEIWTKDDWKSKVYYKYTEAKEITIESLTSKANANSLNVNDYISVIQYGEGVKITMPLSYINYSSKINDQKYIQPIQGKVLAEFNGWIMNGYISYAANMENEIYCEFTPEVVVIDDNSEVIRMGYNKSVIIEDAICKVYMVNQA